MSTSQLHSARMRAPVRHNFVAGDVLVTMQGPGRCAHVYVEEVLSAHAVRVRGVDLQGNLQEQVRTLEGERLKAYARDVLATRYMRERPGCQNEAGGMRP